MHAGMCACACTHALLQTRTCGAPCCCRSPSIMIYGGTIKPGHSTVDGSVLDIVSAFQSYGGCGTWGGDGPRPPALRPKTRTQPCSVRTPVTHMHACVLGCLSEPLAKPRRADAPSPPAAAPHSHLAGAYAAGLWSEEQRFDAVRHACPGAGACGGMYTANTMASS